MFSANELSLRSHTHTHPLLQHPQHTPALRAGESRFLHLLCEGAHADTDTGAHTHVHAHRITGVTHTLTQKREKLEAAVQVSWHR